MNILEKIVADRRKSLSADRAIADTFPARTLPVVPFFQNKKPFIIAECKKASPAKGNLGAPNYKDLARDYYRGGVRHFSVLTERKYFKGSLRDLHELKTISALCFFA